MDMVLIGGKKNGILINYFAFLIVVMELMPTWLPGKVQKK
eukprot:gene15490-18398_t